MPHSSFPLQVSPTIPQPLRRLADLAENFWFSWYPETGQLFRKLDAVLWRKVEGNPKLFLRCVDLACCQQEAAQFKPGITIRRSQRNGTLELAVGGAVTAKMHVGPRQSQVSLRIGLIALQRV